MMKRIAVWIAVLALWLFASAAQAETNEPAQVPLSAGGGTFYVRTAQVEEKDWLFLPAFADVDALFPEASAESDGVRQAQLADGTQLSVMRSENLRALFLFSDDPVNEGRAFIEDCAKHVNRTTGSIAIVDTDGTISYAGRLRQLRGRGNGTWLKEKKPYQFKLEDKADLLQTGVASERNRTWVLLAEAMDPSFLHNKLTFDLGLEIGLEQTSHSEYVDLYYDGEYRGLYLLAEKVEIGEGRVDEVDYEKRIEKWNDQIGVNELDALPVAQGSNRYSNEFTYIQGLADNMRVDAGAYLVEIESKETLSDRCYFMLDDGIHALKNPENASEPMVRYISEKLTEARHTLQNGGVNPETGQTLEEAFDVESFARLALLNELAGNVDGFTYSSSFFILPAESARFEAGPPWDFDLAWRYTIYQNNAFGVGVKDESGWLTDFYKCPAFLQAMKRIYQEELYPIIQTIVLGNGEGQYVQSLDRYVQWISASRRMNNKLLKREGKSRFVSADTYEAEIELLRKFITQRGAWLLRALGEADDDCASVDYILELSWLHPEEPLLIATPWGPLQVVSSTSEELVSATEDAYALWQAEVLFAVGEGRSMHTAPIVTINGTPVSSELLDNGQIKCTFTFEDPSYRPVDYMGEDVGMVYHYDTYIANYPEVSQQCGDDPDAVLEYFCEEGMQLGQQGNAFFDPQRVRADNPAVKSLLENNWSAYYWDFISYGYDEGWTLSTDIRCRPIVTPVDEQ